MYYRAQSTNSTSSQDVGYNREKKKKKKNTSFLPFFLWFPCSNSTVLLSPNVPKQHFLCYNLLRWVVVVGEGATTTCERMRNTNNTGAQIVGRGFRCADRARPIVRRVSHNKTVDTSKDKEIAISCQCTQIDISRKKKRKTRTFSCPLLFFVVSLSKFFFYLSRPRTRRTTLLLLSLSIKQDDVVVDLSLLFLHRTASNPLVLCIL